MIDLEEFAAAVGGPEAGPVTITGLGTRGGPVAGLRCVSAPAGIDWLQPDEMTVRCGAGTPVDELVAALAEHRQTVALPPGGTVGGALSVGRADVRQLGWGPVRDTLLQARYVSAGGEVVKAGGPTVKNVSGFDLCRLLVGARGTLGFIGEVILRTRPLARASQWYRTAAPPATVQRALYRPVSLLWDGTSVWALLDGHPEDLAAQAAALQMEPCDGPPALPAGSRRVMPPAEAMASTGTFVVELGVGVVHHADPWAPADGASRAAALAAAVRREMDPTGRLNPGLPVHG